MAQAPDERPEIDPYNISGSAPAGPPISGLAVSLQPYRSVYSLGSPIWVVAELRNLSGYEVGMGSLFMDNYEIGVVDLGTGRAVPYYPNWQGRVSAFTSLGGVIILAKWSHYAGLRLDRLVQITRPGTYSVRVTIACVFGNDDRPRLPSVSTRLQSNVIIIHVLPAGSQSAAFPQWSSARYLRRPETAPAGPVTDGFALALKPQPKVELGTPMFVNVELRDVSGVMHSVFFGSPHNDYEYTIAGGPSKSVVSGVPLAENRPESRAAPWDSRLVYGEKSLYGNLELRPSYKFTPGTYTLRVTGHPAIDGKRVTLESNPVEVTFVPPATPPPQIVLAESKKVMSVRVETDRSVYASGEPVRVRFVVTNLTGTPLDYYGSGCSPFILGVVTNGAVKVSDRRPCYAALEERLAGLGRIPLGTTTMGWWYSYPYDDRSWPRADLWGLGLRDPGEYAITARAELKGMIFTPRANLTFSGANVVSSPAVTIRILAKDAARTEPGERLDDPSLSAAFQSLLDEYSRLSAPLRDAIVQVGMGVNQSQLSAKVGGQWENDVNGLWDRAGRLPSAGNPKSPYQAVNANLEQAVYRLATAEDHAIHACDAQAANKDLEVADYFVRVVQRELRSGVAKPGDAADPPPAASHWGYCRP